MSNGPIKNITPSEILGFALRHENYDEIVELIRHSMEFHDKWIVNACVLSIEYTAISFGKYPKDIKDSLWVRAKDFPGFWNLKGSIYTAEEMIAEKEASPA